MVIIIVMGKRNNLQKNGLMHLTEDMFFSTYILCLKQAHLKEGQSDFDNKTDSTTKHKKLIGLS